MIEGLEGIEESGDRLGHGFLLPTHSYLPWRIGGNTQVFEGYSRKGFVIPTVVVSEFVKVIGRRLRKETVKVRMRARLSPLELGQPGRGDAGMSRCSRTEFVRLSHSTSSLHLPTASSASIIRSFTPLSLVMGSATSPSPSTTTSTGL